MKDVLSRMEFSDLTYPLINNADVMLVTKGDAARDGLIKQVASPVRWEESIRLMLEMGVDTFVEVGPGKVLCGLVRRIERGLTCFNSEDVESFQETTAALKGMMESSGKEQRGN